MDIVSRVEFALEHALIVSDFIGVSDVTMDYTGKDDDYPIDINPSNAPDGINEVTIAADGSNEFADLFRIFNTVGGYQLDKDYIRSVQEHEQEHYQAARDLGVKSARFGVSFERLVRPGLESELSILPFLRIVKFSTTKLGAALLTAYPTELSPGDQSDVAKYGYTGVEELAELALQRNRFRRDGKLFYPIPLSSTAHTRTARVNG